MGSEALSAEQVDFYNRNGYLIVPGAISGEALDAARAAVAEVVAEQMPLGDKADRLEWEPEPVEGRRIARRIYNPVHQHADFEAIAQGDAVLDRVESLLGGDIQFHHSKLNLKPAEVGSVVEWHQDVAYFPHTNTDLLACLVYFDDAGEENGCLQIVPGQHKGKCFGHTGPDGRFAGKICEPGWQDSLPDPVACEGGAGSMIMMHCLTPHSSTPNRSAAPRRTLIMEFRAADAYPLFFHEQINVTESFTRQVRGRPATDARFTLTSFPIPQVGETYSSLYDLQARYRGD